MWLADMCAILENCLKEMGERVNATETIQHNDQAKGNI
jgi:hypothetical protein